MEILALELGKLGLREKEVRVYLAGLELGPSSVQKIAQKAKITRPTTYQIIKTLKEKGLFIESKQRKKRYFIAQSPERILGILRVQKKELEEKEREFIRIIAALESKYALKEKEAIRVYKGKEGLKALEESFSFTSSPEIFVFCSKTDLKEIKKREVIYQKIKRRLGKIEVKEIFPKKLKLKSKVSGVQRKFSSLNLKGTLILFDKAIFLAPKKPEGYLIESKLIVDLLNSLFLTFWNLI